MAVILFKMIDQATIRVTSGNGGNGSVSGRREKYVPRGGPDGGDGGEGGSVVMRSSGGISTLSEFRYRRLFTAENGGHGSGKKRHGARGAHLEIEVPVGTEVWSNNGEGQRVADLWEDGVRIVIARGGRGGRGNTRFTSPTNRYPVLAEGGDPGESLTLRLELKLLADVGIVGAPNAGKSSLLAAVSGASPKVAGYPFTTIEPALGTVEIGYESFVMVDIPGLIEGAHTGAGLGHDFLRHIQRTKVLIHLIDGEQDDSLGEYLRIRSEIGMFNESLSTKPEIVAVNKADLEGVEEKSDVLRPKLGGHRVHCISALARRGLDGLLDDVAGTLASAREEAAKAPEGDGIPVLRPRPVDRGVEVSRIEGVYVVALRSAERIAAMVDSSDWHAQTQLMEQLRRLGVVSALEKAGARAGDRVKIGKTELEWE